MTLSRAIFTVVALFAIFLPVALVARALYRAGPSRYRAYAGPARTIIYTAAAIAALIALTYISINISASRCGDFRKIISPEYYRGIVGKPAGFYDWFNPCFLRGILDRSAGE